MSKDLEYHTIRKEAVRLLSDGVDSRLLEIEKQLFSTELWDGERERFEYSFMLGPGIVGVYVWPEDLKLSLVDFSKRILAPVVASLAAQLQPIAQAGTE